MRLSNIVVVQSFGTRAEADIALSILESSGIEAMIQADTAGGMREHLAWSGFGFRVLVCEEDVAMARNVLNPPADTDHVGFKHSQPKMKQTARRARSCPQVLPQRSRTTAPAAGALTCPGLAPGFACSYMRKTWRQHATCLTGPTQRAPSPGQVRDRAHIEGVLGRHAELSDDPIFPTVAPSWLLNPGNLRQMRNRTRCGSLHVARRIGSVLRSRM